MPDAKIPPFLGTLGLGDGSFWDVPALPAATAATGAPVGYRLSNVATHYYAMFDTLQAAHPDRMTRVNSGKDASGLYDCVKYVITPATGHWDKTVYLMAGIHGGEDCGIHMIYQFIRLLLESTGLTIPELGYSNNSVRFVIRPMTNPWAYMQSPKTRYNYNHVNLARNTPYNWEGQVTEYPSQDMTNPASVDYRGASAASEPEIQYVIADLEAVKSDLVAVIDCHSFGSLNVTPNYSCTSFLPDRRLPGQNNREYRMLYDWCVNTATGAQFMTDVGFSTTMNYALSQHGVPAWNVEWTHGYWSATLGDSTDMTAAGRCYMNTFLIGTRQNKRRVAFAVKHLTNEPWIDQMLDPSGTLTVDLVAGADSVEIPLYTRSSVDQNGVDRCRGAGLAEFSGEVTLGASAASFVRLRAMLGQVNVGDFPFAVPVSNERYVHFSNTTERIIIPWYHVIRVKEYRGINLGVPFVNLLKWGICLRADVNVTVTIRTFNGVMKFTPCEHPENYERWHIATGAQEILFPPWIITDLGSD